MTRSVPRCRGCSKPLTKARISKRKRTCYGCEVRTRRESAERARERRYAATYGLRLGEYALILALQGGVCAICRRVKGITRRLAVDHDHQTGLVRGLLCKRCNSFVGHIRDNPEVGLWLAEYLRHPPAQQVRPGMGKEAA